MTPQTCKKLLEMGILQAYAEGKVIQCLDDDGTWFNVQQPEFQHSPIRYRIKPEPQFEVGDLVRTSNGTICKIMIADSVARLSNLNAPHLQYAEQLSSLTKVHEVRTPFTFEEAVKACAEHGMVTSNMLRIISIGEHYMVINNGHKLSYKEAEDYNWRFMDDTPIYKVSYEPTPTN